MRRIGLTIAALTAARLGPWPARPAGAAARPELPVREIYTRLIRSGADPQPVGWSGDGREFIYTWTDPELRSRVYQAADPRSGRSRRLLDTESVKSLFSNLASLARGAEGQDEAPEAFAFSPDSERALFLYRGDVYEIHLLNRSLRRWTHSPEAEQAPGYSPDGRCIVFVRESNLFWIDRASGRETAATAGGNPDGTWGQVDWVIEEELGLGTGYWWSPDSRFLAILHLDERAVPVYPLVDWAATHPAVRFQKYPKAGDPNPVATLHCYELATGTIQRIPLAEFPESYIPRVHWAPDSGSLLVQVLNRAQDRLRLVQWTRGAAATRLLLEERDPGWVDVNDQVYLLRARPEFLWGSIRSGRMHLYRYGLDGGLRNAVTSGEWDVTSLDGVDESRGQVYFTATERGPGQRQLYRAPLGGGSVHRLTGEAGTHRVRVSERQPLYVDFFTTDHSPPVLRGGTLDGTDVGGTIRAPEPDLLTPYDLQSWEYLTVPGEGGLTWPARILKPPGFDPGRRYPVLVYVYGGPGAQVVVDDWSPAYLLWHQLVAAKDCLVFSLDNRGSGGRGAAWERAVKGKLGQLELADQLAGVRYLKSLPYVDPERIGIWGWSYGGYMTCLALCAEPPVFRAGVAVAPVVDWRNYDTIYTERYLGLPADNPEGYREGSPVFQADRQEGAFLLAHGTADDNVHLQNAIQFNDALVKAGKQFQLMLYPGMEHGIRSRESRIHLFETMLAFLEEHLFMSATPPEKATDHE